MELQETIISALAEDIGLRVAKKVARQLRGMRQGLQASEDSGLVCLWDEICVQVQGSHSVFWDHYLELIGAILRGHVDGLKAYELDALWLTSKASMEWMWEQEELESDERASSESPPSNGDEVVDMLIEQVLSLAADYTNKRIEKYLEAGFHF